jgi:hypothetical protein
MELIQATSSNIFVGCKIYKDQHSYFVYKINDSSVWAGDKETEEVLSPVKKKYVLFTERMKIVDAKKITYDGLKISKEDADRVANVPGVISAKKFLKECCELSVSKWSTLIGKSSGAWKNSFACEKCDTQINPVKAEGDNVMLSFDYKIFWFNLITKKYVLVKDIVEDIFKKKVA